MKNIGLKDKKVLITGITGFVGSHLAKNLEVLGASVYGISKSHEDEKILKANILDYKAIDSFICDNKITICFHLAGESLVESGQKNPFNVFKVNTEGTLNVLEIARNRKLERVIIASTAHVYGKNKTPSFEGYTPRPSRPYETSKACTDLIAQSYATTFNLSVLIPRFVNIYGPGDMNFTRLIPKTMRSILTGVPIKIWGGNARRDYLFIDDAIEAYIKLASVDINTIGQNRIFNFGGGNRISVEEVMGKIIELYGKKIEIEKIADERIAEISEQYVSSRKAEKILCWKPAVSFEGGLKKTFYWYKTNKDLL